MNHDTRRKVALWRLSVLGPLISMRLEHGDRRTLFAEAAERTYEKPSGHRIKLSARTIEGWYYRYRVRGLQGLEPSRRADAAKSRVLDDELVDLLIRAKREKPRRSVRRLIRILERAGRVERGALSRSTVHRVLVGAALNGRPGRSAGRERRSFIVGVPRVASRMLRASLELAHERDQSFVDEDTMLAACDDLALTRPSAPRESPSASPIKPRRETGTKSRR
jgi:hypothetical protein